MTNAKIKVNLECDHLKKTIELESYKEILFLKERIEKLFYPINLKEYILTYNNKEIAVKYDKSKIGDYFKNKSIITLKITKLINKNKLNKVKNTVNLDNNSIYNPQEDYLIAKRINVREKKDNNLEYKEINKINSNCLCGSTHIAFYCRQCLNYICKSCRCKPSHINHKVIPINNNNNSLHGLTESIKQYCLNIKAESNMCYKALEGYKKLFNNNVIKDLENKKKHLINKIEEFDDKINLLKTRLPNTNNSYSEQQAFKEYKEINNSLNIKIDSILQEINSYETKTNSNNHDELLNKSRNIFESINTYEDKIEYLSQNVLAYKINYDVNKSISIMYDTLIDNINELLEKEYRFDLKFLEEENKLFSSEIYSILRQTVNLNNNLVSGSVNNLYRTNDNYKNIKKEEIKKRNIKKQREYENLTTEEIIQNVDEKEEYNDIINKNNIIDNNNNNSNKTNNLENAEYKLLLKDLSDDIDKLDKLTNNK